MSLNVSEQSILNALSKVPQEYWGDVLEFLHQLEPKSTAHADGEESRPWTITELRALPPDQHDAILETQAARAEHDYRNDPELTAFEAFGPKDLYVDVADAPAR